MRAVAYVRVSIEEQAEGHSPDFQRNNARRDAEHNGWDLIDFYEDIGGHGWDIGRPALRRLILDAKARKFDVVIVWRQDRLSRVNEDLKRILQALVTFGTQVYLDGRLYTAGDKLTVGIKAEVSEEELRKLRKATSEGMRQAMEDGIIVAQAPVGLEKAADKKTFLVTAIGRQVAEAVGHKRSINDVASAFDLHPDKVRRIARNVKDFDNGTLMQRLLTDRKAMYGRKERFAEKRRQERNEFRRWLASVSPGEFD